MDESDRLACAVVRERNTILEPSSRLDRELSGGASRKHAVITTVQSAAELLRSAGEIIRSDHARARLLILQVLELLDGCGDRDPIRSLVQGDLGGLAPWQIRQLRSHIESNLCLPITTSELANISRLSRSYFSRAFKKSFGRTPHEYLRLRRVMRAQDMMLMTDEPLSQIAVACGMADQSHFCKLFRRTVGCNPHLWRRTFKTAADVLPTGGSANAPGHSRRAAVR